MLPFKVFAARKWRQTKLHHSFTCLLLKRERGEGWEEKRIPWIYYSADRWHAVWWPINSIEFRRSRKSNLIIVLIGIGISVNKSAKSWSNDTRSRCSNAIFKRNSLLSELQPNCYVHFFSLCLIRFKVKDRHLRAMSTLCTEIHLLILRIEWIFHCLHKHKPTSGEDELTMPKRHSRFVCHPKENICTKAEQLLLPFAFLFCLLCVYALSFPKFSEIN